MPHPSRLDAPNDADSIRDYIRVLRTRRRTVAAVAVAVVAAAAVWTYRAIPIYSATASIQIAPSPAVSLRGPGAEDCPDDDCDEYDDTEYDTAYNLLTQQSIDFLTVTPLPRTRIFNVSFEDPDPVRAARLANEHAQRLTAESRERKVDRINQASAVISKEVAKAKANLEEAERNAREYAEARGILFLKAGVSAETARLAYLEGQCDRARLERGVNQSTHSRLAGTGGLADPASEGRLAELRREDAKLAVVYREDYDLRKSIHSQIAVLEQTIEAERAATVDHARIDYAAALDREQVFDKACLDQRTYVDRMSGEIVEYNILKQQADSSRAHFNVLLKRLKETDVSSGMAVPSIRVLDRAEVPTAPVKPVRSRVMLMSLGMAIALGIGMAFFQEYMDGTIKSPDDVAARLKLPLLAVVPRFRPEGGRTVGGRRAAPAVLASNPFRKKKRDPAGTGPLADPFVTLGALDSPSSAASEAYRFLRASLLLSKADHPPQAIAVVSSVPGEGKTTTAVQLAASLTKTGARVALVDSDMRRPVLDGIFSLQRRPGLSNLLTGQEQLKNVVHATAIPNLFAIPCGPIPPNPGELLLSHRFAEMLDVLRQYFDYVILDTPSLDNLEDGAVLARAADAAVLVVKAGSTPIQAVRHSMERLDKGRVEVVGVVLNNYTVPGRRTSAPGRPESASPEAASLSGPKL
jgi:capsular exopolysaccharide synthesis family protein